MSLATVRKLVQGYPSDLNVENSIDLILYWGAQRQVVDAVKKVFETYQEAHRLELTDKDRRVLRERLKTAAGKLQEIIDFEEVGAERHDSKHAKHDQELFNSIA